MRHTAYHTLGRIPLGSTGSTESTGSIGVEDLVEGQSLGPLELSVSAPGNERYWASAGVDHPLLRDGVLYPPIAANLTILLTQTVVERQMLHAAQRLRCLGLARVDETLTVTGRVARRYQKRGRTYVDVEAEVANPGGAVWESFATFTAA